MRFLPKQNNIHANVYDKARRGAGFTIDVEPSLREEIDELEVLCEDHMGYGKEYEGQGKAGKRKSLEAAGA